MPAPNEDFGQAVRDAMQWMGCTPEMVAQCLGIKPQTVNAMLSGIVPMRSLVIRFGAEVSRRAESQEGAAAWWSDIDAWLAIAGYPPRREWPRHGSGSAPVAAAGAPMVVRERPPQDPAPAEDPAAQEPAAQHYHPCYDRLPCGESFFHIFWVLDGSGRKVYQLRFPAPVDYKKRAALLKHDLSSMTKFQFERRYAQYRHEEGGE